METFFRQRRINSNQNRYRKQVIIIIIMLNLSQCALENFLISIEVSVSPRINEHNNHRTTENE